MHKSFKILVFIVALLVISCPAIAFEKVISNSRDWRDVYSTMLYATLSDRYPGMFLTSTQHGTIILYTIPKTINGTFIVSSRSQPFVVNYKAVMDGQGYNSVEELVSNNINLDLARRINKEQNIKKFIIVDDAYGYNALSAASYAALDKYYVLFASERNIGQVATLLNDIPPQKIIIYGQVDEIVKTRLAQYNPETINLGDRFDNNIEMIKRYEAIKNSKQVLMSNGEFIESSIMSGQDPVIFIGRGAVPTQIQDYIKQSGFQVAVLIGNELINSATSIRRQLGISVFVKFAQGARNPEGAVASIEDLDKFPMPTYALNLQIYSIMYNKASNSLWVTYRNAAGVGTYLQGTITLIVDNQTKVVGDQDVVFIDKNQYKTIMYDTTLDGTDISAKVYTLFGEGKRSLEYVLQDNKTVDSVDILDASLINITDVSYDKGKSKFLITIKNIGGADAYVNVELLDIYINGELITIASPQNILLKPGQSTTLPVDAILSDTDIQNNPTIKVKAYYGERENSLVKTVTGEYVFKFAKGDIIIYVLVALIVILLLLIVFGRKKCPNCGTKNSRTRKICKKCKHPLYKKK